MPLRRFHLGMCAQQPRTITRNRRVFELGALGCERLFGFRDALLNAVSQDSNPGVRLKALEGLKPLAGDSEVRKTLARVLLSDTNAAIRMQVVDLLVAHRDDAMVGVLQGLVQKEDNNSVRLKVARALKDMNASVGTF